MRTDRAHRRASAAVERTEPPGRRRVAPPLLLLLAAILLLGGLLRGAYLVDLEKDPLFLSPALDAELHDYWARGLALGDWIVPAGRTDPSIRATPYFRPPGYPYVLSAIYWVTGGDRVPTRIAQFGLGLVSALLMFAVARRYGGDAAGVVCAALMATSWNLIFFEGELLDACLLAALTPIVLLAVRAAGDRGRTVTPFLAGVAIGAFALVRPNGLAFLPVAAGWLVWVRRSRGPRNEAWRAAAVLVAGGLLVVLPCTLRNHRVSGEWIPISANGGINLFIGNNPRADGVRAGIPDLETLAGISGWTCFDYPLVVAGLSREVGRPLGYGEASRIWAGKARRWIVENPGTFLALTLKRGAHFLGPAEIGDRDLDLTRASSPVLRRLPGRFPWYLAATVVGLGSLLLESRKHTAGPGPLAHELSDRRETATLLALFVITYVATFLLFFFNARYRVPVLVVFFVFAADAAARAARLAATRRWRVLAIAGAVFSGAGLLASIDPTGYRADAGEWHYQRANAYRDSRRIQEAVGEYEAAIGLSPGSVAPRRDLALLHRNEGQTDEAIRLLQSALAIDPHASEARFDLGQILASRGRYDAAAQEFEAVLVDAPRHAHAHLSLGTSLLQLGRPAEAIGHYSQAESLAPDDPLVAFVVGRALLARGRTAEGLSRLRRAVELAPDFEAARRALAAGSASAVDPSR